MLINALAKEWSHALQAEKNTQDVDDDHKLSYSNVVCRWDRVCNNSVLTAEIQKTVRVLQQVQMEGWHVANMHLLRCIESELELPRKLNDMFFYRCCVGVSARDKPNGKYCSDPDLNETIVEYRKARSLVPEYQSIGVFPYIGASILEVAGTMRVNAETMIVVHFQRRLLRYVQLFLNKSRKEATSIVRACCLSEGTFTTEVQDLRTWLGDIPTEEHIKRNVTHFIPRLYDMLLWNELCQLAEPGMKGCHLFSLLPHSSSFVPSHMKINASTLHGLCARIFAQLKLNILNVPLGKRKQSIVGLWYFQQNKDVVMTQLFDVAQFETANRKFAYQITTNGYSASVLMTKLSVGMMDVTNNGNEDEYLPEGYHPDVAIGLDPGIRYLCTSVGEGAVANPCQQLHFRNRKMKRSSASRPKKKRRKRPRHRRRRTRGTQFAICQIRTLEYRHLAGFHKGRDWLEYLKKRFPVYAVVIAGMPSFKTAEYSTYMNRLDYFWEQLSFLLRFCSEHAFLKWRFFQHRMKSKALCEVAARIVPVPSPKVCIAYGDWSRRDGITRHPSGPVKGLRRALRQRATVILMDEYRTSKVCSSCLGPLSNKLYRNDIGEVTTRNVLHCSTSNCKAEYWDRDVNAAYNILTLLKAKVRGQDRPPALCRAQV